MNNLKLAIFLKIILLMTIILPSVQLVEGEITNDNDEITVVGEHNLSELKNLPADIFEVRGDICYLKKQLHIEPESKMYFDGKDCRELRMYYNATIRISGSAEFKDIKITSYDPSTGKPIEITKETYNNQRPHVYADEPAEDLIITNSEFSYLGYSASDGGSAWGVSSWNLRRASIENSEFHHNYFGFYTWNTKDALIKNNKVYDNIEYGLDFHDYSDNFTVEGNEVYNNGNHGIIFSKWCHNNKIVNNYVHDNAGFAFVKGVQQDYGTHGIMLHQESNGNTIEGNTLENNRIAIYLHESDDNIIRNNKILSDSEEGMYLHRSNNNLITDNSVRNSHKDSLYSYYSDNNTYTNNFFGNGTYFKGTLNGKEYGVYNNATEVDEAFLQAEIQKIVSGTYAGSTNRPSGITGNLESATSFKIYFIAALTAIATLIFLFEGILNHLKKKNGKSNKQHY
jgi:parallel beta-helix repeat protein